MSSEIENELRENADPEKAIALARFFKTGAGEYGDGDIFMGVTVPKIRRIVSFKYKITSLEECIALLRSPIHEVRLLALLIMVKKFETGDEKIKQEIFRAYLVNLDRVNNWDLVDLSADRIVGAFLYMNSKTIQGNAILADLVSSDDLWKKRVAMLATFYFLKQGDPARTFLIADLLLSDKHDLIQKAVGWMLREAGKKCSQEKLESFLKPRYKKMPRTMLRYSIERFPDELRQKYLKGEIKIEQE